MRFYRFSVLFFYVFSLNSLFFAADADLSNSDEKRPALIMEDLDLDKTPYQWLSVLSGHSLAEPVRTSYGWADLTDGRMITAFSENGAVLWQKPIPSGSANFISASQEDFLAVPQKNKKLSFLNPSGTVLWTSEMGFDASAAPFFGRDGRVFVLGKESVACFGINGIRKWSIKTAKQDDTIKPVELNDGSVVIFSASLENGKTIGLRVSPFGEQYERIVFEGRVVNAVSMTDGILVAYADGTLWFCSVNDKAKGLQTKWQMNDLALSESVKFLNIESDVLIAILSPSAFGTKVHIVNTRMESVIRSFDVPEIESINYASYSSNGIFIADKNFGVLYKLSSQRVRGIKFPQNTKKDTYEYVLFGSNGIAVFVSQSWKIIGWRIIRSYGQTKTCKKTSTYKAFYNNTTSNFNRMFSAPKNSRKKELLRGDYAFAEKEFWKDTEFVMNEYFAQRTRKKSVNLGQNQNEEAAYFNLDSQVAVISMLGLFGTREAAACLGKVLTLENDETVLRSAVKAISECGYDPDYAIITAIEALVKNAGKTQDLLIAECCDALYSVCRFMGRPVLFKKGKAILSNLLMPQYSRATKENAKKVYEKLAELDL